MRALALATLGLVLAPPAACPAQSPPVPLGPFSQDVFPGPIAPGAEPLLVHVSEFARLPDFQGAPARLRHMVEAPGADRFIAGTDRGMLYAVSRDGTEVRPYLHVGRDRNDQEGGAGSGLAAPPGGVAVADRPGLGGVAVHPQFAAAGTPGFGKLYTLLERSDNAPPADFTPGRGSRDAWDTVLLEWTARDPASWTYDGGPSREVMRIEQPYKQHDGGTIVFRSGVDPSAPDYGLLYIGLGDGSGAGEGDPLRLAQDLGKVHGKLLRIDPLGSNSTNGRYGVPADNPFAGDGREDTLGEIFAYGLRNPNSFGWDASNGNMYVADIGEAAVEEISLVSAGDNLGWSVWEGSFRVVRRRSLARRFARAWPWAMRFDTEDGHEVATTNARGDPDVIYPVVEYDRHDPLFSATRAVAVTGVVVCRDCNVPQLTGKVLFGDLPSGALMYFSADDPLPNGGPESIRRVLLIEGAGDDGAEGAGKTLLQLVQEKRVAQGRESPGQRVYLRFATSAAGDVFLLNKRDGVVRRLDGLPVAGQLIR